MGNFHRRFFKEGSRDKDHDVIKTSDPGSFISIGNYHVIETIMAGGQGVVMKVRHKTDQNQAVFALKFFKKDDCAQSEIASLKKCSEAGHRNIVALTDSFTWKANTYLVMEYAEEGDLSNYLSKHADMSLCEKVGIICQCVEGLRFIHERIHAVHRDIKPGNIVMKRVTSGGGGSGQVVPKIADFGLAKEVKDDEDDGKEGLRELCGTPPYWAPEMFAVTEKQGAAYGKEVDVFSLGLVSVCVLRNKENPFSVGENRRLNSKLHGQKYNCVPLGQLIQQGEEPVILKVEEIVGDRADGDKKEGEKEELKDIVIDMTQKPENRKKLVTVLDKLRMMEERLNASQSPEAPLSSILLVAAMEIGPTTTYAFSFITAQDEVRVSKSWKDAERPTYRVPTSVLTDEYDQFLEFGFSAEKRYTEDTQDGKIRHLYRFDKKMLKEGVDYETIESVDGHSFDAYNIYTMALAYLKEHMISAIEKCIASRLIEGDVRWVIIIPSAWGLKGKKYITNVLTMNDIHGNVTFKNKMLTTDMEAAAVCCLDSKDFDVSIDSPSGPLRDGDQFLMVNAWDEYVDVGVYSRSHEGIITELQKICLEQGQNDVTIAFVKLLNQILGPEFTAHMQSEKPEAWAGLLVDFNRLSHRAASPVNPKQVNIPLPWSLGSLYQQSVGRSVEQAIRESSNLGVKFSNGMFLINPDKVKDIFGPVYSLVDNISALLNIERFGFTKAKAIFLVGSFAESKYLQELVKIKFGERLSIRVPRDGSLVALKGAVQLGHKEDPCLQ